MGKAAFIVHASTERSFLSVAFHDPIEVLRRAKEEQEAGESVVIITRDRRLYSVAAFETDIAAGRYIVVERPRM